jgi:hypothetical protein
MQWGSLTLVALLAFLLAGCSNSGQTELTQVKSELNQVKGELTQMKDELAKLRTSTSSAADLKWARSVADDFLKFLGPDNDQKAAYAILSPDYRARLSAKERTEGIFAFTEERKEGSYRFTDSRLGNYEVVSWNFDIKGEELAPNGFEATFTGEFGFQYLGSIAPVRCPFTLRVMRGKGSGLWRVNLLTFTPPDRFRHNR